MLNACWHAPDQVMGQVLGVAWQKWPSHPQYLTHHLVRHVLSDEAGVAAALASLDEAMGQRVLHGQSQQHASSVKMAYRCGALLSPRLALQPAGAEAPLNH